MTLFPVHRRTFPIRRIACLPGNTLPVLLNKTLPLSTDLFSALDLAKTVGKEIGSAKNEPLRVGKTERRPGRASYSMPLVMNIPPSASFRLRNEAFPVRVMRRLAGNASTSVGNGIQKALAISLCLLWKVFPTRQGLTGILEPIYPMRNAGVRPS